MWFGYWVAVLRRFAALSILVLLLFSTVLSIRAVSTGAAAPVPTPQTGFAPNPNLLLAQGAMWQYDSYKYVKSIEAGKPVVGYAGVRDSTEILQLGAGQATYRRTATVMNASNPAYQQYIGKSETTTDTQSITSGGLNGTALTDKDLFYSNLISSEPNPGSVTPSLPSIDLLYRALPDPGTRTYSAAQMGITSTTLKATEQITVALHQTLTGPAIGSLDTAKVSMVVDATDAISDLPCKELNGTFSKSGTLHIEFVVQVDMATGLLVDFGMAGTEKVASSCPSLNTDLTFSAKVHLMNLTLGTRPLLVYPTQSNFTTIKLSYLGHTISSSISIDVVKDKDFPPGLDVTLRQTGDKSFKKAPLQISPSSSSVSSVDLNITLTCTQANSACAAAFKTGNYNLVIKASGGDYSDNKTIPLQLLKAKWLVMLYLPADTYPVLENVMLLNVEEMLNVSRSAGTPRVGMLVLVDTAWREPGTQSWTDGNGKPHSLTVDMPKKDVWGISSLPEDQTQLYQVVNGNFTKVGKDWTAKSDYNMSDYRTLKKFVDAAMTQIPAEHNQLILSDHGGGIKGVAWDWRAGNKPMNVTSIAKALDGVTPKLDVLSFDACLMSEMEVLYNLRSYANYFTASELTIPGYGYNYPKFIGNLTKTPNISVTDYVKLIVTSYGERYDGKHAVSGTTSTENATLAAIDSSKLPALAARIDALSNLLLTDYHNANYAFNGTLADVARSCDDPATAKGAVCTWRADHNFPYIDLRGFAANLVASPGITDPKLKDAAKAVIAAVKDAVIANVTDYTKGGKSLTTMYGGMTILMFDTPYKNSWTYQQYSKLEMSTSFGKSTTWPTFMANFNHSSALLNLLTNTIIKLTHKGHILSLDVFDSAGRHVGLSPSQDIHSKTQVDIQIPGAYYDDFADGTMVIVLPAGITDFRTVVNGAFMQEANESFSIAYTAVTNGTVSSTKSVAGTIDRNTLVSAPVILQKGVLSVGNLSVVRPNPPLPPNPDVLLYAAGGAALLLVLAVAVLALRRRGHRPEPVPQVVPPQPRPVVPPRQPTAVMAPSPVAPPVRPAPRGRFCGNCGSAVSPEEAFCPNCGRRV